MIKTIENLSRPGQDPEEGDWVRETVRVNGAVLSVIEREYHAPPEAEE